MQSVVKKYPARITHSDENAAGIRGMPAPGGTPRPGARGTRPGYLER
jgi:hypothetical protein